MGFSINMDPKSQDLHFTFPITPKSRFHIVKNDIFSKLYRNEKNFKDENIEVIKSVNKAIYQTAKNIGLESVFPIKKMY